MFVIGFELSKDQGHPLNPDSNIDIVYPAEIKAKASAANHLSVFFLLNKPESQYNFDQCRFFISSTHQMIYLLVDAYR